MFDLHSVSTNTPSQNPTVHLTVPSSFALPRPPGNAMEESDQSRSIQHLMWHVAANIPQDKTLCLSILAIGRGLNVTQTHLRSILPDLVSFTLDNVRLLALPVHMNETGRGQSGVELMKERMNMLKQVKPLYDVVVVHDFFDMDDNEEWIRGAFEQLRTITKIGGLLGVKLRLIIFEHARLRTFLRDLLRSDTAEACMVGVGTLESDDAEASYMVVLRRLK